LSKLWRESVLCGHWKNFEGSAAMKLYTLAETRLSLLSILVKLPADEPRVFANFILPVLVSIKLFKDRKRNHYVMLIK
jgi:hypothetical protein